MLTTHRYNGYSKINTYEDFYIWFDGKEWIFADKIKQNFQYILGTTRIENYVSIHEEATRYGGGFKSKKACLCYIEQKFNPTLDFYGRRAKNHKVRVSNRLYFVKEYTGKNVKYWENWIHRNVNHVMDWAIDHFNIKDKSPLETKISFTAKTGVSWAYNTRMIRLRPYNCIIPENGETFSYSEYDHINEDSQIGKFKSNDPHHTIMALILHEVAHIINNRINRKLNVEPLKNYTPKTKNEKRGHDSEWQTIYCILREKFVNKHI